MPGEELPSYAGAVISERFNVTEPFKKVESSGGENAALTFQGRSTAYKRLMTTLLAIG